MLALFQWWRGVGSGPGRGARGEVLLPFPCAKRNLGGGREVDLGLETRPKAHAPSPYNYYCYHPSTDFPRFIKTTGSGVVISSSPSDAWLLWARRFVYWSALFSSRLALILWILFVSIFTATGSLTHLYSHVPHHNLVFFILQGRNSAGAQRRSFIPSSGFWLRRG